MKLIKFTCVGGSAVYINPEQVVSVVGDSYNCEVITTNDKGYYISDSISKVVDMLTEYIPKTHY